MRRLRACAALALAGLVLTGCAPGRVAAPSAAVTVTATASPSVSAPPSPDPTASPGPAAAAALVRSFPAGSAPFASVAAPGVLYAAFGVPGSTDEYAYRIERLDLATGAVVRRDVHLSEFRFLAIGPDGLYLSTSQQDKLRRAPDTIVRLDAATLRPLAQRTLQDDALYNGGVVVAAQGSTLAEMDGGGAVRLLDPRTLATLRTVHVLSEDELGAGDGIGSPVFAGGRLWVVAGHREVALTLPALRGAVAVPDESYGRLLGLTDGLVLVGAANLARLAEDGRVTPDPPVAGVDGTESGPVQGVEAASAEGDLVADQPRGGGDRVVLRRATGEAVDSIPLSGAQAALVGAAAGVVWVFGLAGHGGAISAVRVG